MWVPPYIGGASFLNVAGCEKHAPFALNMFLIGSRALPLALEG